jgi:RNA ligase (TIGR02306 family)
MSEWTPIVVKLDKIGKHPNADRLEITEILGGYPVIMQAGLYKPGDLAAYIPVDTVVPDTEQFKFLDGHRRIKAKRLRGIFSMGMLMPAPAGLKEGDSVIEAYGLEKYQTAMEKLEYVNTENEPGPEGWNFPTYTDLEGIRKYKTVLELGEEVILTEKVHGSAARYRWDGERLWVGSRTRIKKFDERNPWWQVALRLDFAGKLAKRADTIFFGEIYGANVQDMTYGLSQIDFRCYDTMNVATQRYNDWDESLKICAEAGVETVPHIYRGPWKGFDEMWSEANGKSTIAQHCREGYVVKPTKERWDHRVGRVCLKCVGEDYLLRKEK